MNNLIKELSISFQCMRGEVSQQQVSAIDIYMAERKH